MKEPLNDVLPSLLRSPPPREVPTLPLLVLHPISGPARSCVAPRLRVRNGRGIASVVPAVGHRWKHRENATSDTVFIARPCVDDVERAKGAKGYWQGVRPRPETSQISAMLTRIERCIDLERALTQRR